MSIWYFAWLIIQNLFDLMLLAGVLLLHLAALASLLSLPLIGLLIWLKLKERSS